MLNARLSEFSEVLQKEADVVLHHIKNTDSRSAKKRHITVDLWESRCGIRRPFFLLFPFFYEMLKHKQ